MSTATETLEVVCDLTGQIPGVVVLGSNALAAIVSICIRAKGNKAIDVLQRIALSANTPIEPWLEEPGENTEVEQTIVVCSRERDGLEFGELQMLGIHLVWNLQKFGILATKDAHVLLRKWGATPVGA